ncbi:MAG: rRNA maturation RNase YbeY [Candidatus Pseudobacter hemicellulosilyticus]|uniref:Endoribonuclease YbeY n=1 Tax=Candidatus Pseudobacter hemicellulosilyticus TaxID=3121375 RepID=A0AAJ6BIH9_9BACT|nr:MAG: rRNA maturation RNase YbeY [Pseudobacter sp.]
MMMTKPSSVVSFHYLVPVSLKERTRLQAFIVQLFKKEKKALGGLTYIFCSDDYLLEINKQYLQHDYFTDIITFDLSTTPASIEGEIYISVDRVRDNAQQFNTSITRELHRVIFHGALHLCGYKDKTPKEEVLMRKMEDKYLRLYR